MSSQLFLALWGAWLCTAGTASAALDDSFLTRATAFVTPLIPPYALGDRWHLQVEPAYTPLRYLPGKSLGLMTQQAIVWAGFFPVEAAPLEAQCYAGVGWREGLGTDSLIEGGATLNDLRGPHVNVLGRGWVARAPETAWRLTVHGQVALPGWTRHGFSTLGMFHRWEAPILGTTLTAQAAHLWHGVDGYGVDQPDESHASFGVHLPISEGWFVLLAAGGFQSGGAGRTMVSPSLILPVMGYAVILGAGYDLSPAKVHAVHIGLFRFGEPK